MLLHERLRWTNQQTATLKPNLCSSSENRLRKQSGGLLPPSGANRLLCAYAPCAPRARALRAIRCCPRLVASFGLRSCARPSASHAPPCRTGLPPLFRMEVYSPQKVGHWLKQVGTPLPVCAPAHALRPKSGTLPLFGLSRHKTASKKPSKLFLQNSKIVRAPFDGARH